MLPMSFLLLSMKPFAGGSEAKSDDVMLTISSSNQQEAMPVGHLRTWRPEVEAPSRISIHACKVDKGWQR